MRYILILTVILFLSGCDGKSRSVTKMMWSEDKSTPAIVIKEKDLTDEGIKKLKALIGSNVIYDDTRKVYLVAASEHADWTKVTLKVLATPFTVVADGVQYTVVVAVANPQITLSIIQALLK